MATKEQASRRYYELKAIDPDRLRIKGRDGMRAWRAANPKRALAASRRSEAANPAKRREQRRILYAAAPEKFRQKTRNYRGARPGYATEQNRDWRYRNPDVAKANHAIKRARKKSAEGRHTADDVRRIRAEQNDQCAVCAVDLGGEGHIDHKVPLARGGSNWPDNIQITCVSCNLKKWAHYTPII